MFLLDTNVLSHSSKKKQHPAVVRWLTSQETLAIPFSAIQEIQQGIIDVSGQNPARAAEILVWLETLLLTNFEFPDLTVDVARTLGSLYCCRPLKHLWLPDASSRREKRPGHDLTISAIAIVHKLPIATMDAKDFKLIDRVFGLPCGAYNPMSAQWIVEPHSLRNASLVAA